MPSPEPGYLGFLKIGVSASPTNKMSGVTDISLPLAVAQYDVTNMDAGGTNGYQQYIPGLIGLKMTAKANLDPTDTNGQAVARTAVTARTLLYFIASANGTNTQTFSGYVDNWTEHAPVNNKADLTFSVTVSGAITLA